MADQRPIRAYTDEQLRDYLAGDAARDVASQIESQLAYDDALQARLASLDVLTATLLGPADELLAAAPVDRLTGSLAAAADELQRRARAAGRRRPFAAGRRTLGLLAAALLIVFALGVLTGRALFPPAAEPARSGPPAWIAAAVDYLNLYSAETLTAPTLDSAQKVDMVRRSSAHLSLDLSAAVTEVQGLIFVRAELLRFGGSPLVQLAYVHTSGTPVALYVLSKPAADVAPPPAAGLLSGRVDGLMVTYWQTRRHEFVFVGKLTEQQMSAIAETMTEKLGAR